MSIQNGIVISAGYEATAYFDGGSVKIQISLIKHGSRWQILGFRVIPQEPEEEEYSI